MPEARIIETALETIRKRSLPEGGFAMYRGKSFRPNVTAWAVLALKAGQKDPKVLTMLILKACAKRSISN